MYQNNVVYQNDVISLRNIEEIEAALKNKSKDQYISILNNLIKKARIYPQCVINDIEEMYKFLCINYACHRKLLGDISYLKLLENIKHDLVLNKYDTTLVDQEIVATQQKIQKQDTNVNYYDLELSVIEDNKREIINNQLKKIPQTIHKFVQEQDGLKQTKQDCTTISKNIQNLESQNLKLTEIVKVNDEILKILQGNINTISKNFNEILRGVFLSKKINHIIATNHRNEDLFTLKIQDNQIIPICNYQNNIPEDIQTIINDTLAMVIDYTLQQVFNSKMPQQQQKHQDDEISDEKGINKNSIQMPIVNKYNQFEKAKKAKQLQSTINLDIIQSTKHELNKLSQRFSAISDHIFSDPSIQTIIQKDKTIDAPMYLSQEQINTSIDALEKFYNQTKTNLCKILDQHIKYDNKKNILSIQETLFEDEAAMSAIIKLLIEDFTQAIPIHKLFSEIQTSQNQGKIFGKDYQNISTLLKTISSFGTTEDNIQMTKDMKAFHNKKMLTQDKDTLLQKLKTILQIFLNDNKLSDNIPLFREQINSIDLLSLQKDKTVQPKQHVYFQDDAIYDRVYIQLQKSLINLQDKQSQLQKSLINLQDKQSQLQKYTSQNTILEQNQLLPKTQAQDETMIITQSEQQNNNLRTLTSTSLTKKVNETKIYLLQQDISAIDQQLIETQEASNNLTQIKSKIQLQSNEPDPEKTFIPPNNQRIADITILQNDINKLIAKIHNENNNPLKQAYIDTLKSLYFKQFKLYLAILNIHLPEELNELENLPIYITEQPQSLESNPFILQTVNVIKTVFERMQDDLMNLVYSYEEISLNQNNSSHTNKTTSQEIKAKIDTALNEINEFQHILIQLNHAISEDSIVTNKRRAIKELIKESSDFNNDLQAKIYDDVIIKNERKIMENYKTCKKEIISDPNIIQPSQQVPSNPSIIQFARQISSDKNITILIDYIYENYSPFLNKYQISRMDRIMKENKQNPNYIDQSDKEFIINAFKDLVNKKNKYLEDELRQKLQDNTNYNDPFLNAQENGKLSKRHAVLNYIHSCAKQKSSSCIPWRNKQIQQTQPISKITSCNSLHDANTCTHEYTLSFNKFVSSIAQHIKNKHTHPFKINAVDTNGTKNYTISTTTQDNNPIDLYEMNEKNARINAITAQMKKISHNAKPKGTKDKDMLKIQITCTLEDIQKLLTEDQIKEIDQFHYLALSDDYDDQEEQRFLDKCNQYITLYKQQNAKMPINEGLEYSIGRNDDTEELASYSIYKSLQGTPNITPTMKKIQDEITEYIEKKYSGKFTEAQMKEIISQNYADKLKEKELYTYISGTEEELKVISRKLKQKKDGNWNNALPQPITHPSPTFKNNNPNHTHYISLTSEQVDILYNYLNRSTDVKKKRNTQNKNQQLSQEREKRIKTKYNKLIKECEIDTILADKAEKMIKNFN
ncbi:hypothetical protein Deia_00925 [Candidatus Deianiraea vastatrix]|uniref:Uncharacterized protein n=1 Tax=Candidatus Deianiraea vastatrix TaxID=2163644 RepID=A0A5B8XEG8_9RICK|nr:hypothetical protein Deia_00925 [Candidatus Deianiraea vastatrix]